MKKIKIWDNLEYENFGFFGIIKFNLQIIFIPLFINNPLTFKTLENSIIIRNRTMSN
jgi:hypothetical protein